MSKIVLTISDKYVPTWGIQEIIREIVTNALDGEALGHPKTIAYSPKTRTLKVSNSGAKLDKAVLLLGHTTKVGAENQRGQFGEGLKLALLAAARSDTELKIVNHDESWIPSMEESDVFPGQKVLTVSIRSVNATGSLTFLIEGVTEQEWIETQNRFLCLSTPQDIRKVSSVASVIFDDTRAGKLFVKDVFVTEKKELVFGYNLGDVKMNRDRRMVDEVDLKSTTATTWSILVETDLLGGSRKTFEECLIPMIENQSEDVQWIRYRLGGLTRKAIVEDFEKKNGPKAVPVRSGQEAVAAGHVGLRGVIVSELHSEILCDQMGTLQEQIKKHCDSVAEVYQLSHLTSEEVFAYDRILSYMEMAAKIRGHAPLALRTQIVRFNGNCQGMWSMGVISLARNILLDTPTLIATFAHEIGHDIAGDGDVRHERAECDLLGTFADLLLKETLYLGNYGPILAAHEPHRDWVPRSEVTQT